MEENRVKTVERPQNKNLKTDAGPGRPPGQRNYATIYRDALIKLAAINKKTPEELEDEILSSGLLNARKGDYRYYKDVLDRIHGTPIQRTESKNLDVTVDVGVKSDDLIAIAKLLEQRDRENSTSGDGISSNAVGEEVQD